MPREQLSDYTLERAHTLIVRGLTMGQVARTLRVSRASLYNYGLRSSRGYVRSA